MVLSAAPGARETKRLFLVFPVMLPPALEVPNFLQPETSLLFFALPFHLHILRQARVPRKAQQRKGPYQLASQHKSSRIMGCAVEAGGLVTTSVT